MPNHKHIYKLTALCLLLVAALSYYGCRKDSKTQTVTITDPVIAQAKTWYDGAYPQSNATVNAPQTKTTYAVNDPAFDLSQYARPDWQHPSKYVRFCKNVIEMPIDPATNSNFSIRNGAAGRDYANKAYTRSYYLLINNGKGYQAFLMTIIADSSYVKNDTGKLKNNTYRKHDADFSGLVLYFTPKGQYVIGYRYANGQMVVPGTSTTTTNAVNSSSRGITVDDEVACTDWYLVTWYGDEIVDVEYEYTECSSGASANGAGGTTTPPPCPTTSTPPTTGGGSGGLNAIKQPIIYTEKAPGGPTSGGGDDGGGYPDPTTDPCTVVVPPIDTINDPCDQKSKLNALAQNAIISAQNQQLFNYLQNSSFEYGYDQNLTNWTSITLVYQYFCTYRLQSG